MLTFANAKINLGLHIIKKREDGYHEIETLMYPIQWKDSVEILKSKSENTTLTTYGLKVDGDMEDNLVVKAFRLLEKKFELPPIDIFLLKAVPFGAGLGGGSSDASTTLKLLNETFSLSLSTVELKGFASQLGSDCPFFIENLPQMAKGRGEILTKFELEIPYSYLAVVYPKILVSSKLAYSKVTPREPINSLAEVLLNPNEWQTKLINDFEESVFAQFPAIGDIKKLLYKIGATYASLSGSGSSVFGFFNQEPDTHLFEEKGYQVWKEKIKK